MAGDRHHQHGEDEEDAGDQLVRRVMRYWSESGVKFVLSGTNLLLTHFNRTLPLQYI